LNPLGKPCGGVFSPFLGSDDALCRFVFASEPGIYEMTSSKVMSEERYFLCRGAWGAELLMKDTGSHRASGVGSGGRCERYRDLRAYGVEEGRSSGLQGTFSIRRAGRG
jgi:hypothetical protein